MYDEINISRVYFTYKGQREHVLEGETRSEVSL